MLSALLAIFTVYASESPTSALVGAPTPVEVTVLVTLTTGAVGMTSGDAPGYDVPPVPADNAGIQDDRGAAAQVRGHGCHFDGVVTGVRRGDVAEVEGEGVASGYCGVWGLVGETGPDLRGSAWSVWVDTVWVTNCISSVSAPPVVLRVRTSLAVPRVLGETVMR